ncbi:unnamed protein product [Paramecium sonneborni]|uniref:Uncharacterized protein n=1 Tax=Paramecium sonneborni TaxID=65129 RepID=A0A8S1JZB8_9CILI|nr:unnamed protein product [Paramecium sonneborni]
MCYFSCLIQFYTKMTKIDLKNQPNLKIQGKRIQFQSKLLIINRQMNSQKMLIIDVFNQSQNEKLYINIDTLGDLTDTNNLIKCQS